MDFLDLTLKYWPLIIAVVGIGATWMRMQVIDKDHERRISTLEADKKENTILLVQIQKELVEVKTLIEVYITKRKR